MGMSISFYVGPVIVVNNVNSKEAWDIRDFVADELDEIFCQGQGELQKEGTLYLITNRKFSGSWHLDRYLDDADQPFEISEEDHSVEFDETFGESTQRLMTYIRENHPNAQYEMKFMVVPGCFSRQLMHTEKQSKYSTKQRYLLDSIGVEDPDHMREGWYAISINKHLSDEFLEEFKNKVCWNFALQYQRLSEETLLKLENHICWITASLHQRLSEKFIEEHQDKVHWPAIFEGQILSSDFRKNFSHKPGAAEYESVHPDLTKEDRVFRAIRYAEKYKLEYDSKYLYAYRSHSSTGHRILQCHDGYKEGVYYRCSRCDHRQIMRHSFGYLILPNRDDGNVKVRVKLEDFAVADLGTKKFGDFNFPKGRARVWGFEIIEKYFGNIEKQEETAQNKKNKRERLFKEINYRGDYNNPYWEVISSSYELSEEFIKEFQNNVIWFKISQFQTLSEKFIREFQDKVSWHHIFRYQNLSSDFIKEFEDKVD